MPTLKISETFLQLFFQVAGFFLDCFENHRYITIIAVIVATLIVAALIGTAIGKVKRAIRYKRF